MSVRLLQGDALAMLRTLPDASVQCVITSPPYFALRDYGTATWDAGSVECDHRAPSRFDYPLNPGLGPTGVQTQASNAGSNGTPQYRDICGKCGARRIDQQIGLEKSPADFIAALMAVFEEVKRVLRPDGLCFVNLGDSYSGSGKGPSASHNAPTGGANPHSTGLNSGATFPGIPAKNLLLVPERFAIAMQDSGWIVRSRIAWCKTSAMPESVRDRPTSAWEHIFMFSRQARYFYDAEAVRQPYPASSLERMKYQVQDMRTGVVGKYRDQMQKSVAGANAVSRGNPGPNAAGANLRNFWLLGPEPSREEHYAAFPTEIPKRCILAGSRPGDTVLDPFLGSGTTALVADRLGRNAIGIELSPRYVEISRRRIESDETLFSEPVSVETWEQPDLFAGAL